MHASISGRPRRALSAVLAALLCLVALAPAVLGHEERKVAGYDVEVGFLDEPVFVGQRSGLELFVHKGDQAVEGVEKSLKAEAIYGSQKIDLPIAATETPGDYQSVFVPTAAGQYAFHLFGSIEDNPVDQTFTSGPTTFSDVRDAVSGQFPVQLPSVVDLAAQAKKGQDAAAQMPIAIGLGAAGAVLGLVALGIALAGRRRPA
ncbi:MAG TPA: hypothetical protein VFI28_10410 [Candidatus Limnocylindrales bacterium]|nr:hypothetical protein [Candidatus Limnocylindrales bacterium]